MMLKSLKTLPYVAAQHYKITKKGGGVSGLDFTLIQHRLLHLVGALLEKRGRANIAVVKPRQIMSTTAFNAIEFHMSQAIDGLKTLILTHREKVSVEVFQNLKRFQEQMPPELKRETTQNNDYKIVYKHLAELMVGTAGTDSGRGFPCLILQLSELGRYKDRHVRDVQEGAMQAHASSEPGAILAAESTSGGEGNYFHEIAKMGYRNPKAEWFTAFYGWHEMPEYRMKPPKGWAPDSEECRLMKAFGWDLEQTYWRNYKLHMQMRGNLSAFMREYPATFEEAFSSAEGRLIDSVVLINALNSLTVPDFSQPLVLGVDPAGQGDRTVLQLRRGFYMEDPLIFNKMDDYTLTNIILKLVDDRRVDHTFIDMGYGHGTYNNLVVGHSMRNITGVHFGAQPSKENRLLYANKRTEMAARFQDWIEEGPDQMGGTARIPDNAEFLRDIRMIPDLEFSGQGQKFTLATKEDIKAELGKSPDCFDAAILTFAETVRPKEFLNQTIQSAYQGSSLLSVENAFQAFGGAGESNGLIINPHARFYSFGNGGQQ